MKTGMFDGEKYHGYCLRDGDRETRARTPDDEQHTDSGPAGPTARGHISMAQQRRRQRAQKTIMFDGKLFPPVLVLVKQIANLEREHPTMSGLRISVPPDQRLARREMRDPKLWQAV